MNILILSAGTRCQLVNYFCKKENGFNKVVSTDCSKYAPALYGADKHYIVPKMNEAAYLPTIKEICKTENINVLLPLQENELELIAEHRTEFENMGILVVISDIASVKMCRDKWLMYKHLTDKGIPCVNTYDYNTESEKIKELTLPVMAKERNGFGSMGVLKINHWPLLKAYAQSTDENLIVQPFHDTMELGVDAYVDFVSGELVAVFAKEKLRMRAGETEKSKSVKDKKINELVKLVLREMNFKGPIDMDILLCDGEYRILEINPRFGGGYPHAYECGVNFTKFISTNARGKANVPVIGEYRENQILLKFTDAVLKNKEDLF